MTEPCAVDGCTNPAATSARLAFCWAHAKRRQRKGTVDGQVRPYGRPAAQLLRNAAARLADAEDDDEHRRADRMLQEYARKLARRNVQQGAKTAPTADRRRPQP